jgi:large subunit ribosomal protein L24
MHVRKGDTVLVIAGNDKGKQGQIKEVLREKGRVVVEGVNLRWKHRKPSQQNPKGERVQRETGIHASNVMHLDPATGKGVRRRPAAETKATKKPESKATKKTGAKAAKK